MSPGNYDDKTYRRPSLRVCDIRFYRLDMRTRFPFRYGIACMTYAPHLFVAATVEIDDRVIQGISADGLPPKWFTKNPNTTFEQDDLPAMLRVIRHAADTAVELGSQPSFFAWWLLMYEAQCAWASQENIAPLLAGLGISLIERAVLDAVCRATGMPVFHVIRNNLLGIEFEHVRPALRGMEPRDVLASRPRNRVRLRHTVGLGDPLTGDDTSVVETPRDGLPFTLEDNIRKYGLRYFKIKLSGNLDFDRERLLAIASILRRCVAGRGRFTLDGNENFQTIAEFREVWTALLDSEELRCFFDQSLLFVEQPVHRTHALDDSVGEELRDWVDAPPIIIDESDADLNCLPAALGLGYSGTSHKNCKGIVKGLVGAATLRCKAMTDSPLILSAEDLGNVGPVALLQDLAMVAALGISHVERNGHHYFAGLSMFPERIREEMLEQHSDLYARHADGYPVLAIQVGQLSLKSVNEAPFGLKPLLDLTPFEAWEF